jgi:hypothetical protein
LGRQQPLQHTKDLVIVEAGIGTRSIDQFVVQPTAVVAAGSWHVDSASAAYATIPLRRCDAFHDGLWCWSGLEMRIAQSGHKLVLGSQSMLLIEEHDMAGKVLAACVLAGFVSLPRCVFHMSMLLPSNILGMISKCLNKRQGSLYGTIDTISEP